MRRLAAVIVASLIAGLLVPVTQAGAQEPVVREVQAGALSPSGPRPYEYVKYYPQTVQVRRGEHVRFGFQGFHTVTFLPGDAGSGPNPNHAPLTRADEVPGRLAFGEDAFFPIGDCGRGDQAACELTSTNQTLSSGVPIFDGSPWTVKVDLPVGTYRYHCNIHPNMHGSVQVVPGTPANPTPAQIANQIAADEAEADAFVGANQSAPSTTRPDGTRLFTVKAGATTPGKVAILDYLPHSLTIAPGDEVQWQMGPDEVHSVTFPGEGVGGFFFTPGPPVTYGLGGAGVTFACDHDGRTSGLPGTPNPAPFCLAGELELQLSPWMASSHPGPNGNVVGYHDSGIMVSASSPDWAKGRPPGSGETFPSSFNGTFPAPGEFNYACTIHTSATSLEGAFPGMTGSIVVAQS